MHEAGGAREEKYHLPCGSVSCPSRNTSFHQPLAESMKGTGMLGGSCPGYNVPKAFVITLLSLRLQVSFSYFIQECEEEAKTRMFTLETKKFPNAAAQGRQEASQG